jgi:MFS family permease
MRQAQPWESRLPFYYGWVIVAVSFINAFIGAGAIWVVGVFAIGMQAELHWSRASIFGALSVRSVLPMLFAPLMGPLLDRKHGALIISIVAGVLSALSIAGAGFVTEEWQFWLLFGVLGGSVAAGQGFLLPSTIVPKWFTRNRGTVMTWATMGSGVSALVLPPLAALAVEAFGWRVSWWLLAALTLVFGVVPCVLIRRQPSDVGLTTDGRGPQSSAAAALDERHFTLRQAVGTRAYWILGLALAAGSLSITGLPANLVPIYVERGLSPTQAALAFSVYGLCSVACRFVWGELGNRRHIRQVLLLISVYMALVTPLLMLMAPHVAMLYAGLVGFGIGGFVALHQLVWPAYFGRLHLGSIVGSMRPLSTVTAAGGPVLLALLFDATGSYDVSLWLLAGSWVACVALLLLAPSQAPSPSVGLARSWTTPVSGGTN